MNVSDPAGSCCGSTTTDTPAPPAGDTSAPLFPMADNACCPAEVASCCPPQPTDELPGYKLWSFVEAWLDTPAGPVPRVRTSLDREDLLGRWQMRWGIGRERYRIAPGLHAVGNPGTKSPVLVTANYKMTFDQLRRDCAGLDAWILVLETYGINVWCAAGKGTFGTDEIVRRVRASGLEKVVEHRRLILPQLGAPGVSAHKVKQGCGFSVKYGPVRSTDLKRYLANDETATAEMRRVTFTTMERLVLTPVELSLVVGKHTLWILLGLFLLAGIGPQVFSLSAAWARGWSAVGVGLLGLLAGAVATPVLLPWLPRPQFAIKGAVAGAVAALLALGLGGGSATLTGGLAAVLTVTAVSSYCAMNFTGATPYTSPSGVEREMRQALPYQLGAVAVAGVLWLASAFTA